MSGYEDLAANVRLVIALQNALDAAGFNLTVGTYPSALRTAESRLPPFAVVAREGRVNQVFPSAKRRAFLFDLWDTGVHLGEGSTETLEHLARLIGLWLLSRVTPDELAA